MDAGQAPLLTVSGLEQYYGESHTLWSIDLTVRRGARACLMGRNGVGKTTLLKCLMGLVPVRGGTIRYRAADGPEDGVELTALRAEDRARIGIAYVPQGREIFPRLTVEENLRVGLGVPRAGRAASRGIPDLVFELFPVLETMRSRRGGDLSGGQQQQLAIGRALVLEPALLILDEPTEGIQPNIVQEIGDIIIRLNEELGLTVLLVEQKLPFARRVTDSFVILDKGRKVAQGATAELGDDLVRQYLTV